jgi:hypothetical protein
MKKKFILSLILLAFAGSNVVVPYVHCGYGSMWKYG